MDWRLGKLCGLVAASETVAAPVLGNASGNIGGNLAENIGGLLREVCWVVPASASRASVGVSGLFS